MSTTLFKYSYFFKVFPADKQFFNKPAYKPLTSAGQLADIERTAFPAGYPCWNNLPEASHAVSHYFSFPVSMCHAIIENLRSVVSNNEFLEIMTNMTSSIAFSHENTGRNMVESDLVVYVEMTNREIAMNQLSLKWVYDPVVPKFEDVYFNPKFWRKNNNEIMRFQGVRELNANERIKLNNGETKSGIESCKIAIEPLFIDEVLFSDKPPFKGVDSTNVSATLSLTGFSLNIKGWKYPFLKQGDGEDNTLSTTQLEMTFEHEGGSLLSMDSKFDKFNRLVNTVYKRDTSEIYLSEDMAFPLKYRTLICNDTLPEEVRNAWKVESMIYSFIGDQQNAKDENEANDLRKVQNARFKDMVFKFGPAHV